ncbi:hypothetical protein Vretifemale_18530, partial [Volvox reticuliferus]
SELAVAATAGGTGSTAVTSAAGAIATSGAPTAPTGTAGATVAPIGTAGATAATGAAGATDATGAAGATDAAGAACMSAGTAQAGFTTGGFPKAVAAMCVNGIDVSNEVMAATVPTAVVSMNSERSWSSAVDRNADVLETPVPLGTSGEAGGARSCSDGGSTDADGNGKEIPGGKSDGRDDDASANGDCCGSQHVVGNITCGCILGSAAAPVTQGVAEICVVITLAAAAGATTRCGAVAIPAANAGDASAGCGTISFAATGAAAAAVAGLIVAAPDRGMGTGTGTG